MQEKKHHKLHGKDNAKHQKPQTGHHHKKKHNSLMNDNIFVAALVLLVAGAAVSLVTNAPENDIVNRENDNIGGFAATQPNIITQDPFWTHEYIGYDSGKRNIQFYEQQARNFVTLGVSAHGEANLFYQGRQFRIFVQNVNLDDSAVGVDLNADLHVDEKAEAGDRFILESS